ncbi:hypothetical protein KFK09_015108 [Dendrobium nobile]|uniref:Uncharacterized protein n=1 Tax=Dendrobium nobile TaxID=94219 RepID=A0A8T3B5S2_DENNO|nr:hypothetical protein KFK09_015108 [Dendrobium nobile]
MRLLTLFAQRKGCGRALMTAHPSKSILCICILLSTSMLKHPLCHQNMDGDWCDPGEPSIDLHAGHGIKRKWRDGNAGMIFYNTFLQLMTVSYIQNSKLACFCQ